MKHQVIILSALILLLSFVATQANLFECDDKLATSDATIIGPKIPGNSDEERSGNKVRDVLKEWSCKLKKSTANLGANVKEKTKQWSENIREGIQKLKEKSKDLQKKLQTKYNDLKDNLKKDSAESMEIGEKKLLFKPDEVIDTDVVIIDQKCGNGFILDALGNCKKFREFAEIIN